MKPSDFTISRDAEGIKYVTRRDQLTKHNREDTWQVEQKPGGRGRGREWATLGVHPLSWLLSNSRLEKVPFVSESHTSSNRLLLSNQDKGCTPSVAHSLALPLGPALLNLWTDGSSNGFMYEILEYDYMIGVQLLLWKKYISKLNPACEVFWQKPKEIAPASGSWYCNASVVVNTLGDKMKVISTGAKCSKVYTNHCLCATCVSTLDDVGFANRDIMSVNGHHSEQSINYYSTTSDANKKQMSKVLAAKVVSHGCENIPTSLQKPAPSSSVAQAVHKPSPNLARPSRT